MRACVTCGARTQILEDVHVRQRVDLHLSGVRDLAKAGERVGAVDVHRARAADALAARAAEGERRVHLVLHLDQRVEHHRAALVHIHLVVLHLRLGARVRVPAIDGESFPVAGGRRLPRLEYPGSA